MADNAQVAPPDGAPVRGALPAFGAASQQLNAWIAGEQALALLRAARTAGILAATGTPRTVDEVATMTGLAGARVADLLYVLDAHGIVAREGVAIPPRHQLRAP